MTDTDRLLHFRAFPASLERTGARDLTGLLVPYDTVADVVDALGDGKMEVYREGFRRGAFGPQVNHAGSAQKIGLVHRHEGGLGYLGPFVGLREGTDGLYGSVRVLPTKADDVGVLLDAGIDELSIEFRLPRANHTEVDDAGVRWRTRAHLDQVALEPKGAYSRAQVLAYRAELDDEQREQAAADAEADAKAKAEADEAAAQAAADDEARERAEAEAAETVERRERWAALSERLPGELAKQESLVRDYGIVDPGGWRRQS